MRIVIFTADPQLEHTVWWSIVLHAPQTRAVLVCRQTTSRTPRDVVRRLRKNIRKHGLIYIPYRAGVALIDLARQTVRGRSDAIPAAPPPHVSLKVFETPDIHSEEAIARVRDWRPDLGLSVGAPILRRSIFALPTKGSLNLHLGRVPDFRGAPPGFWELERGATTLGATVHWIDEGLDTGNVVASGTVPLSPADTLSDAQRRLTALGRIVLLDALEQVADGEVPGTPQPPGGRTYRYPTVRQRLALAWRMGRRRLKATALNPTFVAKRLAALLALAVVRPLRDTWRTLRGTHPVRVFTFHRVSELCRDPLTVRPEIFRRQIDYVARSHTILPLDEALDLVRERAPLRRPVAAITFDDAYRSVHAEARQVLSDIGVGGCCFVCTDLVGTDRRYEHDEGNPAREYLDVMSWEQLDELVGLGWRIGGHTANHVRVSECTGRVLEYELGSSLERIRQRFGDRRVAMAFPFGQATDTSREAEDVARRLGYDAYLSNWGGDNRADGDTFRFQRIDIGGDLPSFMWKAWSHGFDFRRWVRRRAPVHSFSA